MKQKLILALSFSLSLLNAMEKMELFFTTDIAQCLCIYGTESLNDAGMLISAFTQANQALAKSFNGSSTCLFIIKKLSDRFDCSDQQAAEILSIQAARNRLYLQNTFQSYCKGFAHPYDDNNKTMNSRFAKLKRDNVDFNFSYSDGCRTGLMVALSLTDPEPEAAKYLILNGANLHIEDKNGFSAHSRIFRFHPCLIPFLLEHKKLEPNKKNRHGMTPLIYLMVSLWDMRSLEYISQVQHGTKILLDLGADPELEPTKGGSAVAYAHNKQNQYPQFVTLLEDAIKKKHASQK